ncbi:MAG: hypothetical protein M3397_01385 [Actinomycetota bacterium]|jgi:hypothetical protein|nr:hypothetical protein [Rubrobacter sp.]MDQ3566718.1 hypothetical protein [Actinomycetota bacterium]
MRYRLIVIFVTGTAFFSVLPIYAPPIVLQSDEIPRFLFGLGAAAVAAAVLRLSVGRVRWIPVVLSGALSGAIVYTFAYAIPRYGLSDGWSLSGRLVLWTTIYTGLPALAGAALVGLALALVSRLRRSSGR